MQALYNMWQAMDDDSYVFSQDDVNAANEWEPFEAELGDLPENSAGRRRANEIMKLFPRL